MKTLRTVATENALAGLVLGWASLQATAAVIRVPAQYPTIQAAVDAAASGDEIRIAPGTYTEQVLIASKNLRLVGAPGTVLKAFAGMTAVTLPHFAHEPVELLLGVAMCDRVLVRGLTLDGGRLGDGHPKLAGAIFHGSGGSAEHCTFRGFRGESGLAAGMGLGAGNFAVLNRPPQDVSVLGNVFEDNTESLLLTAWDSTDPHPEPLRLRFQLEDNLIYGFGPSETAAQTGIEIRAGAAGEVKHNLIAGHNYTRPDFRFSFDIHADGLGVALLPTRYVNNTLQDNQVHLASFLAIDAQFVENTSEGSGNGAFNLGIPSSGRADQIVANRFGNLTSGVILIGDDPIFGTTLGIASDVTLIGNRFCEVSTPILIEPLVTGVEEQGNQFNACWNCGGGGEQDWKWDGISSCLAPATSKADCTHRAGDDFPGGALRVARQVGRDGRQSHRRGCGYGLLHVRQELAGVARGISRR